MSFAMQNYRRPFIYTRVLKYDNPEEAFQKRNHFFHTIWIFFIQLNEHCLNFASSLAKGLRSTLPLL